MSETTVLKGRSHLWEAAGSAQLLLSLEPSPPLPDTVLVPHPCGSLSWPCLMRRRNKNVNHTPPYRISFVSQQRGYKNISQPVSIGMGWMFSLTSGSELRALHVFSLLIKPSKRPYGVAIFTHPDKWGKSFKDGGKDSSGSPKEGWVHLIISPRAFIFKARFINIFLS